MVKQTRIIFTWGDVVQIRFVCPKCDGAMTQKLDASERLPDQCPSCKQPWSKEPGIRSSDQIFLEALRHYLKQDVFHVQLQFELDGEKTE